jgi:16S rRNA (guanine527-N7)-methyltransferase
MREQNYETIKNDFQGFIGYSDEAFSLLIKHVQLVEQANKTTNITSISEFEAAMYLHAYDSLLGLEVLREAIPGDFIDIGSGAGFPGIPLSLFCERNALLIDSIKKKATILQNLVSELCLTDRVTVKAIRSEIEATTNPNYYAAVTVRAVSSLSSVMELASPLLANDGTLIAYKGPGVTSELVEAKEIQAVLGMEIVRVDYHQIDRLGSERYIVIAKKVAEPKISLPRATGRAQKKPLK